MGLDSHFPILGKVLNALTRDIWFSSINNNLLMFLITCPLLKYSCCCCLDAKSSQTLCDPMDCSAPGPSFHGISQARILEWVAISFSRDLPALEPNPSPALAGRFFTAEPPGKPLLAIYPSYIAYVFSSSPGLLRVVSRGSL